MKILRATLLVMYKMWFYIVIIVSIILLFPFLLISILKESWYPFFFRIARIWGMLILAGMGLIPLVKRETHYKKRQSYLFVANHTSMTDIMLMLYVTKNPFVFVGKKELGRIPVFGFFYKRTCILVDRGNVKSRIEVFKRAQQKLDMGLSVCIFPEGGIPEDTSVLLDEFKDGAFRLAIEHRIPVAPMTFHDNKKRFSDELLKTGGGPGKLRVKVHNVIPTGILEMEDKRMLKNQTREIIMQELLHPTV
jgi:1-acyl-sn-glycerol-3-phosphate acyltransferase